MRATSQNEVIRPELLTALGTYQFHAKVVDDAGNASSCSIASASYTLTKSQGILGKTSGNYYHRCSVMANQEVKCWGLGSSGQLGHGVKANVNYPVTVLGVNGTGTLENIVQVSTGYHHSCGLTSAGQVYCWGKGANGRLGNNVSTDSSYPVAVKNIAGTGALGGIVQISSGEEHTCAVTSAMLVICWGKGNSGRLGHDATTDSLLPITVKGVAGLGNLSGIVQVSAGKEYTCALSVAGEVMCWGRGNLGQLGNGRKEDRRTPVIVSNDRYILGNIIQISSGKEHVCALTNDAKVKCWGANGGNQGRLGNRNHSAAEYPYPIAVLAGATGNGLLANIVQVSSGTHHSCAVTSDSKVKCWGSGNLGALGNNSTDDKNYPVDVVGEGQSLLSNIVEVSSGIDYACALISNGNVKCWGKGNDGQLGTKQNAHSPYPLLPVVADNGAIGSLVTTTFQRRYDCSLAACALDGIVLAQGNVTINTADSTAVLAIDVSGIVANETVKIYSDKTCGAQVGSDVTTDPASVQTASLEEGAHQFYFKRTNAHCSKNYLSYIFDTTVSAAPNAVSVVGPSSSSIATPVIRVAGAPLGDTVYIYTDANCSDAEKVGGIRVSAQAQDVPLDSPLTAAGNYKFYARAVDGAGNKSACSTSSASYTLEKFQSFLAKLALGDSHSCALAEEGIVKCWGAGGGGRLGHGGTPSSSAPVTTSSAGGAALSDVIQVSAGAEHTCGLTASGGVKCWGNGANGRLGHNVLTSSVSPVAVKDVAGTGTLSGIVQISLGQEHTCAVTSAMKVLCWGKGDFGRLGHDATTDSSLPVFVKDVSGAGELSGIVQVSAGAQHSCALSIEGQVFCWGKGSDGRLGNRQTADKTLPVSVFAGSTGSALLRNIIQISAGDWHICALTEGGEVRCWGHNGSQGKLGNRETSNKHYPVSVLAGATGSTHLAGVVQVKSAGAHSCALLSSGQVKCWGSGEYGKLGNNGTANKRYPVDVAFGGGLLSNIVEVSVGRDHSCALSASNQVRCWGKGSSGQLGNNRYQNDLSPVTVVTDYKTPHALPVSTFQQHYTCFTGCALGEITLALSPTINNPGTAADVTFNVFGISAGKSVKFYSDSGCGTTLGTTATSGSSWVNLTGLSQGSHQFYFKVIGSDGSDLTSCSKTFVHYVRLADNTPPAVPTGLSMESGSSSFITRPYISVAGLTAGEIVYVYKEDTCTSASKVGGARATGQTQSLELDRITVLGSHKFYAKAVDDARNESACSAVFASYTLTEFVDTLPTFALGRDMGCALVSTAGTAKCWGKGAKGLGNDSYN